MLVDHVPRGKWFAYDDSIYLMLAPNPLLDGLNVNCLRMSDYAFVWLSGVDVQTFAADSEIPIHRPQPEPDKPIYVHG